MRIGNRVKQRLVDEFQAADISRGISIAGNDTYLSGVCLELGAPIATFDSRNPQRFEVLPLNKYF